MITRSGLYAIRAAGVLARHPARVWQGAKRIAEAADVPACYLVKVLQTLARAGVVASQKGPGGGFRLARPAERITLWEVLEPIDHPGRRAGCLLGRTRCSDDDPCALHEGWASLRGGYRELLRRTTLAHLAAHPSAGPAEEFLSTAMRRVTPTSPVES